jgi:hypothetical protein
VLSLPGGGSVTLSPDTVRSCRALGAVRSAIAVAAERGTRQLYSGSA